MLDAESEKTRFNIYERKFEGFEKSGTGNKYDLVFFSESFQYVDMGKSLETLDLILNPSGKIIIFDFFRKDNVEGISPLGGGHSLGEFHKAVKRGSYTIISDEDYTKNFSPNLTLVNEILTERLIPSAQVTDRFLLDNHAFPYKLVKFCFRKKLKKIKWKYSEDRNAESFEKYKSYRLISLEKRKR